MTDKDRLFDIYMRELLVWNEKINLTAIRTPEEIKIKHFEDSLTLLPHIPTSEINIIDIGAGAGFPGLPIKISRPEISLTLVDSVGKKVEFLKHVIQNLGLENTTALVARAEELGQDPKYRESFDVALARGVASLPVLAEYCLPLVKVGGIFIAQKNAGTDELESAKNAIQTLGGKVKSVIPVTNPLLPNREIIIIEKISPTPKEYPRIVGIPSKKPL